MLKIGRVGTRCPTCLNSVAVLLIPMMGNIATVLLLCCGTVAATVLYAPKLRFAFSFLEFDEPVLPEWHEIEVIADFCPSSDFVRGASTVLSFEKVQDSLCAVFFAVDRVGGLDLP